MRVKNGKVAIGRVRVKRAVRECQTQVDPDGSGVNDGGIPDLNGLEVPA
jgi:hypothetical protein